ncbi:hypothetical protein D9619_005296 [Psilocybe cf. subviscida]|uniref:Uncharacterized protein n=1 Tax=Psilocybe cf. subviscida TaxID=2480587 RepID=A0A8H5BW82_9AGAR|nr:hypothetical protein D9619_005296 [Psilocybe cf. subviscida]
MRVILFLFRLTNCSYKGNRAWTKTLFQTQKGQLQADNHTVEVIYHGEGTKMPLTLCALAATPSDFSALDIQAADHDHLRSNSEHKSARRTSNLSTGMIAGINSRAAITFILLSIGVIWWWKRWRRMRSKRAQEKRSSATDSLLPFAFHPAFGFLDMDKRRNNVTTALPPVTSNEQGEDNGPRSTDTRPSSSRFESRPPSYRTAHSIPR